MTAEHPIVAVAAIVFDEEGRVLVIERGRPPGAGLWSVPGGRLELGESIADGVAREVLEETGLIVEVGALAEVVERVTRTEAGTWHHVIHDHLARVIGGELRAGDDVRAARFVTAQELVALATTEGLIEVIERARRMTLTWAGS